MTPSLSIIVPVLNEAAHLRGSLMRLAALRPAVEIIVVDGGSSDQTVAIAASVAERVLEAPRGRARQMNAGAAAAQGDILLFLHADTILPEGAVGLIVKGLGKTPGNTHVWGRFDVQITGQHPMLPVIATLMNLRSRLSGIATGDQAMFCTRAAFQKVGGFPDIALMEDIALSKALKRLSHPASLSAKVTTSGRRWDAHGAWRTIALMWRLRAAYALGANPDELAVRYAYKPK